MIAEALEKLGATSRGRAVTMEKIMPGVSKRRFRALIRAEREAGALICSKKDTGGGYWLSEEPADLQEQINMQTRMGREALKLAGYFRHRLRDIRDGRSLF